MLVRKGERNILRKGNCVLIMSVLKLEHREGTGERRPEGTSGLLPWGHVHCEGEKVRPDSKGNRKLLEDFKQEKLLLYVSWKYPLWLQRGEWIGGRWAWKLGAQVKRLLQ